MQQEEREWLAAAQQGDSQAFSRLVDMYAKPVYNLCYRMLGSPQDAEDAAQETFLRAFRSLRRYDPQRKFATWLLSIAANHCIDQYRRVRPQFVSLEEVAEIELQEARPGPEKAALAHEALDEVQRLLASLPARDRAALILYYWYEYSYAELAKALSISVPALKARLHRARRSLAATWQQSQGNPLFARRSLYEKTIS
ncbi:MAG: sigma-70 family RNA polymerase sigma factor [Anaerolineales bacterium]